MNPYYEFDLPFLPATLARAEEVNDQFTAIEEGFNAVKIDVDFADTKAQEAAASAAESAASAAEALVSETNARNFAEQIGSDVDDFDSEYSAREWATGDFVPSGSSRQWAFGTRPEGSSREWALQLGTAVDGTDYSAREWAIGDDAPEGSAREWALQLDATVDGTDYSAKEWAVGETVPEGSAKFWAEAAAGTANYAGSYDNGTTYTQGQIVDQGGQLYVLRAATSIGVAPPDPIWLPIGRVLIPFAYDDRAELRGIDGPDSLIIAVDGLGFFTWQPVELVDDDETAFATENGSWSMIGTHPDTVFAHQIVEEEEQNARIENAESRIGGAESQIEDIETLGRVGLSATFVSTATTIGNNQRIDYEVSVTGAEIGDAVILTSSQDIDGGTNGRVLLYGYVKTSNIVNIAIKNPSGVSTSINNPISIFIRVLKQTGE